MTLVTVGAWLGVITWRERRLTSAVHMLPRGVQEATYRRSHEELTTTCATEPQLREHCRDEAKFILRFPQCDSECRQLAHGWLSSSR